MSWLYTIVFAGLVLSSEGSSVSTVTPIVVSGPVAVETLRLDETEKFEQTYPLNAGGRVNISNVNGSITMEAWDRNEVRLEYTKTADTKERLADVAVKIDSKPDFLSVETDYGSWKTNNGDRWRNGGKLQVDFRLMVPRGAVLNEIETVNGSVSVSDFVNITKVSAVNGSVTATNIRGTAKLSTVNGGVIASFDRLDTSSKISLETVNGQVNLVLPSDANATVRANSLNGNITNDFGLPVHKGKYVGRDLYGRLGNGDVQIKLESVNGGLSIGRKNDGKGLSPATNLLPQKDKDDQGWDMDENRVFQSAKVDKEIAKAVKESSKTKVAAKAISDAQKELSRIQPEIAKITAGSIALAADAIKQSAQMMRTDEFKQKIKDSEFAHLAALATIADMSFTPAIPRVETKRESFPVKGVPKVTVEAKGCSVVVHGWDKSEVQYRVTHFSDPRNRADLNVSENHSESTVNIKVENPDKSARGGRFFNGSNRVRIEVFVPHKSNMKITSDREIRIEGVSGDIDLSGSDESINVRDVDGKLRVFSADGRIRVIGFRGDIDAQTSDGTINLEGDFKSIKARATDGSIILTLPENVSAELQTNGREILGEGIALTRISGDESTGKYRIGNGGALFELRTDGEIRVRGSGVLKEMF